LAEIRIKVQDEDGTERYVASDSSGVLRTILDSPNLAIDSATGRLKVITQGGSGGTNVVDDAAFTVGTDSGTPAMGLYDDTATDTVDEGDVGVVRMDALRRLYVLDGAVPETPVYVATVATGDTAVIGTPGVGKSLYIQRVSIINGGGAVVTANLQENGAATNYGPGDLAADGGGIVMDFGMHGWQLTANKGLDINCGSTCDLHVTVQQYYII
jgi:hypothetical protein